MALSSELISQFVKITNDGKDTKKESTVYGTTVSQNGTTFVKLDGSELLTPISTTADVQPGERVIVMIKNHSATITGNMTSPAARVTEVRQIKTDIEDVSEVASKISEFEIAIAKKVSTEDFDAEVARIDELQSSNVKINQTLASHFADIVDLQADIVTINDTLVANEADIKALQTDKLDADQAAITYAKISDLQATNADINDLEAMHGEFERLTANSFEAVNASISELQTDKLSASDIEGKYANIDFSNIGKAAIEKFFAVSGMIEDIVVGDGTVTGKLVGVTINGDVIEGNTVKADKLVVKGTDGLYYKLNTDGVSIEAEQTDENSINGSVIQAQSITASKISVNDLVAFDATIGGFTITDSSLYSEIKDSEGNHTRGIYFDKEGQVNLGDSNNFIRYYKDEDGTYKLAISADTILYDVNGVQYSLSDLGSLGEYVKIDTYEGEPCIELGETDSDFKLLITNTKMVFKEGVSEVAYFTNKSLHIKKAVIEDELQQGGFVWQSRSNGNLGLIWKGGE